MGAGPDNTPKRVTLGFITQVALVVIGVVLIKQQKSIKEVSEQNTNTVTQVVENWNTMPLVNMKVTDDKCPSGTDSIFVRPWGGSTSGCLVNKLDTWGYSTSQTIMTQSEYDSYISSRTTKNSKSWQVRQREPCMPISMNGPKLQDEFFDMRFCGYRGSSTFATAVRPTPNGKMDSKGEEVYECPKDFVACSAATSKGHTVCISKTKDKKKDCPITEMKFVPQLDGQNYALDPDYEVYPVDDDYSFITSKTKGDNLPITSLKVERMPCLDPKDTSMAPAERFYPLENDRNSHDCDLIEQYGERYDKRYTDLGLTISEYEVQKESKVLKKLEDLPMFDMYSSEQSKKAILYKFWSRPTISWKLSCDDKHPRSSVLRAANKESDKDSLREGTIIALLAIAFGGGVLGSFIYMVLFCGACCSRSDFGKTRVPGIICLGIQMILLFVSTILMNGQRGELTERKESLEALSFVNGCGDEYMNIPENFVPMIKEVNGNAMFAVILGTVQFALSLVLCGACAIGGGSKGSEDKDSSDDEDLHDNADEEKQYLMNEQH